jgi:hypothetical protein
MDLLANETGPVTETDQCERRIFGTETQIQSVSYLVPSFGTVRSGTYSGGPGFDSARSPAILAAFNLSRQLLG